MTPNSAQRIPLDLGADSYDIVIEYGLAEQLAHHLEPWNVGQQMVVLTQEAILEHHRNIVDELKLQGLKIDVITVPGDESAKNIRYAESVWAQMVELGCDRSSVLIAMGGGVVGDLGGFVAATYMRGIGYVQLPTTLLAMIDSAIGGKTAVNLSAGKNLVGAVYQPKAVLVDPNFLSTLPRRNVVSSLAEAVKYGFIRDPSIFTTFQDRFDDLIALKDRALLSEIITKSCRIKAQIVSNDQFENGERKLLNYGHTIGHAFEAMNSYNGLYHGEAIIYGMRCANFISHQKGLLANKEYEAAQTVLQRFDLPELGKLSADEILNLVSHDKKNINGKLSFILLDGIGNGVISTNVSSEDIVRSLEVVR